MNSTELIKKCNERFTELSNLTDIFNKIRAAKNIVDAVNNLINQIKL